MQLIHAKYIADEIVGLLTPYTDIINIAGSVRRKVEEVGDVEIVAIPKITVKEERDLFGDITHTSKEVHPEFQRIVKGLGRVIKGQVTGRYMQIELERMIGNMDERINLDLFMPQPFDYWRQFAVRTGSAEYTRRYISNQWVKKGFRGTPDGIYPQSKCYQATEKSWAVQKEYKGLPPLTWKSEEDFFRWLGVQYINPEYRNL